MDIFEISGNVVRPTPQILQVKIFKKIWERDKTEKKSTAMQEFAYVEFMVSEKKTNPYKGYSDEIREKKIREGVIHTEEWEPDILIDAAIEWYNEWQEEAAPSMRYYKANLSAVEKTIVYLQDGINYEERNKSGMPVHKFTDVVRGVREADGVYSWNPLL